MRLHRYIKETRSILGQPTLPHHLGKRLSAQGLCCLKNGIFLLIFLFITAIASPAHAAIVTWDGGGGDTNWNTCANWSLDTCPTAADIATFNATSVKNATITTDPNVDGIDIQAGYTGIISQNAGVTITVGAANFVQASGTFTGGDSAIQTTDLIINGGSFTATSGTMTVGDDFTISGGTFSHNGGTVTFTGGGNAAFTFDVAPTLNHVIFNRTNRIDITGTSPTLDIDGNFTLTSATDIDGGTILLAGNITTSDTLVTGNSAFTIDGGNTQTIDGSGVNAALPNLTINKSGGSLTFLNDISINSNLTYTAGIVDTTTNNVTIQFGLTGINSTTLINSSTLQFNHVTFNKTNNLDVSGTMDINGNLTINSATNLRALTSGDRITLAGNLISSDATIDGDLDIEFDSTTDQTINIGSNDLPNGLLTVNKTSGVVRLLSNLDLSLNGNITQDVTITQGTLDLNGFNLTVPDLLTVGATGTFQLQGNETVLSTTQTLATGSTVIYDGAVTVTGLAMGDSYHHLIFNNATTGNWTLDAPLTVNGDLTITDGIVNTNSASSFAVNVTGHYTQNSGQFEANASTLTVGGNFSGDVAIDETDYNSASIVLTGTGSLALNNLSTFWVNGFNNLTVGQSGNITTFDQALTVNNILTVGSGEFTTTGTGRIHLTAAGNILSLDPNATISIQALKFHGSGVVQNLPALAAGYDTNIALSGIDTIVTQTGNVTINGNNSLRIIGDTLADRAGTFNTANFDLNIGGNIEIGAGADTALKRLNAGSSAITVGGDIIIADVTGGTAQADFISGTSTVTLNGNTTQNITSRGSAFNNLTITNASNVVTFADALNTTNLTAITPSTQLTFTAATMNTISGTLNINGQAAGTRVQLRSTGGQYTFDVTAGDQNISYVDVQNSAANSNNIFANGSLDGGGNDNGTGDPQWVFNTLLVTNTLDDLNPGSLRYAITNAASGDTILFDTTTFPTGAPATITISNVLPSMAAGNVTIDASNAGVVIDGASLPLNPSLNCFEITSDNNTIMGLRIQGCTSYAIWVISASNNTIGGDNTVGTGPSGQGNVLISNDSGGVLLANNANNNTISGNYIGTDLSSTPGLSNGTGVNISSSSFNIIGGTTIGERNILSSNLGGGVYLGTSGSPPLPATFNTIIGNYIGTDVSGAAALPNQGFAGIYIGPAVNSTTIGGTTANARNVISGNTGTGIILSSTGDDNVISGNYIGVDATGNSPLPNDLGVLVSSQIGAVNTIGGLTAGAGNVISGNTNVGIGHVYAGTLAVLGNYIGTNAGGDALPNGTAGIWLDDPGVTMNLGNMSESQSNVIGPATGTGINIAGGTLNLAGTIDINSDVTLSAGTVNMDNAAVNLSGSWSNSGATVNPGTSTMVLDGTTTQAITSNGNAFNNLTVTNASNVVTFADALSTTNLTAITPSTQLAFVDSITHTVSGTLNLNGQASSTEVVLTSTAPGTQFSLDVGAANPQTVSYVSVRDSNALGSDITAINSVNVSGNDDQASSPQWVFAVVGPFTWTNNNGAGDNNWNTATNWYGGAVPGPSDVALFTGIFDYPANINTSPNVAGIQIVSGYTSTITQLTGNTITLGSSGYSQASGTFSGGDSAIDVNGSFSLTGGSFTSTSATMDIANDFTVGSGATFTHNSGAIQFTNGNNRVVDVGNANFNNVELNMSGGSMNVTGTFDVNGNLTLTGVNNIENGTIAVAGNVTTTDPSIRGSGVILFNGVNQTLMCDGGVPGCRGAIPAIEINNTGTLTIDDTIELGGSAGWTLTAGAVDTTANAAIIIFDGPVNRAVTDSSTIFNQVQLEMGGGVLTVNGTMDVDGPFIISGVNNIENGVIAVSGDVTTTDAGVGGSGKILFDGVNQTLQCDGLTPGCTGAIPGIEVNNTGVLTIDDTIEIDGSSGWTLTAGTIDATTNSTNIVFDNPANRVINDSSTAFNNVELDMNGGSVTVTGSMDINGNFTITGVNNIDTGTITVAGNLTSTDSVVGGTAAITLDGGNAQSIDVGTGSLPAGTLTVNKLSNTAALISDLVLNNTGQDLVITQNSLDLNGNALTVNDSITIAAAGVLLGQSSTINIGGNWTNNGTFTAATSTVTLNGTGTQSITSGGSAFNNLTVANSTDVVTFADALSTTNLTAITPSTQLAFADSMTHTISGTLNLNGQAASTEVALTSTTPGVQFSLDVGATNPQTVSYVSVQDSNALGSDITAINSVNAGGNDDLASSPQWVFAVVDPFTWTGADAGNNNWDDPDNWYGFSVPGAGDTAIFSPLFNVDADINVAINVQGIQINSGYSGMITQQAGNIVTIGSSGYSQAGGTFTGGDSLIDVNNNFLLSGGSFTATSNSLNVAGNFTLSTGAFTHNSGTVTLDSSTADQTVTSAGNTFNNLTLNNTATAGNNDIIIIDALDVNGALGVNRGDLDISTNDPTINTAGDVWVGFSGASVDSTGRSAIWTFDGITNYNDTTGGSQDIKDIVISGTLNLGVINLHVRTIHVTAAATLNLGGGAYRLRINGTGTPFIMDGTLQLPGTSFVEYTGTGSTTNITNIPYSILTLAPTAATTYVLTGNQSGGNSITDNLNINNNTTLDVTGSNFDLTTFRFSNSGTFLARDSTILINENWINSGTFTAGNSTVTLNGTGTQSITSGGSAFNNLTVTNSTDVVTFADALSTTNLTAITPSTQLAFVDSITHTVSGTLNLNGQAASTEVALTSTTPGVQFSLDVGAANPQTVSYVSVQDSNALGSDITALNSVNVSNNDDTPTGVPPQWVFSGGLMVTNTLDDLNPGSLRYAVANAAANDTILFDTSLFQTGSPQTIMLGSTLTLSTGSVTIDASNAGVTLDGGGVASDCINITSNNNVVMGLRIQNCTDDGILISSGTGNTIGGDNTSGSGPSGEGNVVVSNGGDGIQVNSNANLFYGNFIGTDGSIALGNAGEGINLFGDSNTIGGTGTGQRNIISGNASSGLVLSGAASSVIQNNYIGVDMNGTATLGNGSRGISFINGSTFNTVGGTTSAARNIISGNGNPGIRFNGSTTTNNTVIGNYIGTDVTGTVDLGNSGNGIDFFNGAQFNTIGGNAANMRNIISGNDSNGIDLSSASNITISGNYIGTDVSGTLALGNSSRSINIRGASSNNTIGGNVAGAGNVVAGSNSININIEGSSTSTTIAGNIIGLNAAGNAILGSTNFGIILQGSAASNTIGGSSAAERNIISGHNNEAIRLSDTSSNNIVLGNYIGTDISGSANLGNGMGIQIMNDSTSNIIGGTAANSGNTISWNNGDGIYHNSTGTNSLLGNYIGTNASSASMPNTGDGIDINNGTASLGSSSESQSNVIGPNSNNGIFLRASGTLNLGGIVDINDDLNLLGTLNMNDASLLLSGNWTNASTTVNAGTSTLTLDGTNQAITGSSTFYNITKSVTAADSLTVQAGTLQTINGLATLQGSGAGSRLALRSNTTGVRFNIAFNGTTSFDFLDVQDSDASPSSVTKPLYPANSIDSGNTLDWFSAAPGAVTSVIAEISPNSAITGSASNPFSFYILPTIGGTDTGINQTVITAPTGYSNIVITDVMVNSALLTAGTGCPTVGGGEYCAVISGQDMTINFGTAITTTLTPIQVDFTTDVPATIGTTTFIFTVDDTTTFTAGQTGTAGDADGNATNSNSLDVNLAAAGDVVTSVVAEITPDTAVSNSATTPFRFHLLPTIEGSDTGFNRTIITMPTGYTSLNVTATLVNGTPLTAGAACPTVSPGEYCTTISGQDVIIDFGSAITTTLTPIRIDLTSDTPNTTGITTITYAVDDSTTTTIPPLTGIEGDADGNSTNSNSLDILLLSVDATLSTVSALPEIIVADGSSTAEIVVTLLDSNGNPVSGKTVQINSDRGATDNIIQPPGATDANGIARGTISSSTLGESTITVINTTDGITLQATPTVYFTQGEALTLTKIANKQDVAVGDLVTYTIEVKNTTNTDIQQVRLEDVIPDNFKYRAGSTLLNGTPAPDPAGNRTLTFTLGTVPALVDTNGNGEADPGEIGYITYDYQLIVGSGAMPGKYTNTAVAKDVCDRCTVSSDVTASVSVVLDPLFDLGTIIGKVFHDKNGDNWQDENEPGIAGAMVVLDEGTYALTDTHGRYHFPAVTPGERLLKINLATLPSGTTLSTSETQVVSVTPGLLAKANFGAIQNIVIKEIGQAGERGLLVSVTEIPKDISLIGNAEIQNIIVNGSQVRLPQADVRLYVDGIPSEALNFSGDKLEQPAVFQIDVSQTEEVKSWTLKVMTPDGKTVREFNGNSRPPKRIVWDGYDTDNVQVTGGNLYHYQLAINFQDGSHATSARRLIGIDHKSVIELNLSGGSFKAGDFSLNENAIAMLKDAAETLRRFPREQVVIEGHADSTGDNTVNLNLSQKRAEAAHAYLVGVEGISPMRLKLRWYGEARPIAPNDTVKGRLLNRRVTMKGLVSDITRADRRNRFNRTASASINGKPVKLDRLGRFFLTIKEKNIFIEMSDRYGRSTSTNLSSPQFSIAQPADEMLIPYFSENDSAAEGSLTPYTHQLIGTTTPGSLIQIGKDKIAASGDGTFSYPLPLSHGKQSQQIVIYDPQGFTYITELQIDVRPFNDHNVPVYLEDPVPELKLNLPPTGFAVKEGDYTLSGSTAPDNMVLINNQVVRTEPDGKFTHTVQLKQGENPVHVKTVDQRGYVGAIDHTIGAGESQLFFMAFADGKFSQLKTSGYIQGSGQESASELYSEGRIAFYLKGKIKGKYLITAALDTGQGEVNSLFSDLDDDGSRTLLRNLDPDYYYPVYGDNSTVVYDTQSQGKFYLAVDSETIHGVVGNYKLDLSDNELAAYRRTLYGGLFEYQSLSRTAFGQHDTVVRLFSAQTRQSNVRDELRATGGSLYYLSQRNIIEGSEQVFIVIKDKNTGLTLSRQLQQQNIDYSIKYLGGRLLFTRPVASTQQDSNIINDALLAGNPVYIEVDYEYYVAAFEKSASGLHARQQIGDNFAIGATYVDDNLAAGRYELQGINSEVRIMKNSRIIAEIAESSGSEGEVFSSNDGGLQFSPITSSEQTGQATKIAAEIDIGELVGRPNRLMAGAYVKELDPGFQANGNSSDQGKQKRGADLMVRITDKNTLKLKHDQAQSTAVTPAGSVDSSQQSTAQWQYKAEQWSLVGEYRDQQAEDSSGTKLSNNSIAATKLTGQLTDQLEVSITHQTTLEGIANDQNSVGLKYRLTENLHLEGRATGGDKGDAGEARISYRTDKASVYITERLNDNQSGKTTSTIIGGETSTATVAGAESGKVYSEYQWDNGNQGDKSLSLVGVEQQWKIEDGWKFNLSSEYSDINAASGTTSRTTIATGISYMNNGTKISSRNEIRNDRGSERKQQYLTSNTIEYSLNPDYIVLAKYRYSITKNLTKGVNDARFEEQSIGLAYRPTRNDWFNALARYTRLSDMSPLNLSSASVVTSRMDVLSIEWSYQITKKLEWSEKLALRLKRERTDKYADTETQTQLSIHRLNYTLPWQLRLGTEYRTLRQKEANDQRSGWLSEITWETNSNLRLGVGYNFTDFSDNEFSANNYSTKGWFIRVQGKY